MAERRVALTRILAEDPDLDIDTSLDHLRRELAAEVHRVDAGANVTAEIHDQILTVTATPGTGRASERDRLDRAIQTVTDQWHHELIEQITGR